MAVSTEGLSRLSVGGAMLSRIARIEKIASIAPATLNLDDPSDGCDIDLVPHQPKQRKIRYALSNSFGFGGTNASIVLKRPDA